LKWVMEASLAKTLAHKLRISVAKVYQRYQTTIRTDRGPQKVLRVEIEREEGKKPLVAQWGGITLARNKSAILDDQPYRTWNTRTELIQRLLADRCELCGSNRSIQVHHVRALKDLERKGRTQMPRWAREMAARRRKTLVVCRKCHTDIHAGRHQGQPIKRTQHRRAG
jgi:hypothetical protein